MTILNTSQVPTPATKPATTGAKTAGKTIEVTTPSHLTPLNPSAAIVAPIKPPNSACEEDDGRPNSQVSRFQRIPPTSPARMMTSIGTPISPGTGAPFEPWMEMILLLTVKATSIDKKAPSRFKIADKATAAFGLSAPVATEVAIALAVSWKPFVKSKASAVTTTTHKIKRASFTGTSC
jgi:hypothetical protein